MAENDDQEKKHPKLKEQFISNIKGKDFVLYAGLLDLGHQIGIKSIQVQPIQYPSKDNGMEAICKATIESIDGRIFSEIADANPKNVNRMIVEHILRMAATRAKARALRDMTNIGMTCLEELGDLDQIAGGHNESAPPKTTANQKPVTVNNKKESKPDENTQKRKEVAEKNPKGNPKAKEAEKKQPDSNESKLIKPVANMSIAQKNAILSLAKRRGIAEEELSKMVEEAFNSSLDNISSGDASSFIRQLQQAA